MTCHYIIKQCTTRWKEVIGNYNYCPCGVYEYALQRFMATTALAGTWLSTFLEMRATAIKCAADIFQKDINENRVPDNVHAKAHLNTAGNMIFRGPPRTRSVHPAMPGIMEREPQSRPGYNYGRHDDPIGHRFDPEGKKWGFMQHPSPPSYFVQELMCDVQWTDNMKIRGFPPEFDATSGARVQKHGGTDKSVGPPMQGGSGASSGAESQEWQHMYAEWWETTLPCCSTAAIGSHTWNHG